MNETKNNALQKSDATIGIGFVAMFVCIISGLIITIVLQSLWFIVYGMIFGFTIFLVGALVSLIYFCRTPPALRLQGPM